MIGWNRVVLGVTVLALVASALVIAAVASAGGGSNIANAPKVAYGAQTFGNTDSVAPIGCDKDEYWILPMIAGDQLVLNFENSSPGLGTEYVQVYAPSVNDFNLDNSNTIASENMHSNSHSQLLFAAPSTGNYPIDFYADNCSGEAGAYDFTAYVHHKARLVMSLAQTISRSGSVHIQAHYPDGTMIPSGLGATLYGFWNKSWNKIGAAAVANGQITIRYTLPSYLKGTRVKLEAKAGGASFLAAKVSGAAYVG